MRWRCLRKERLHSRLWSFFPPKVAEKVIGDAEEQHMQPEALDVDAVEPPTSPVSKRQKSSARDGDSSTSSLEAERSAPNTCQTVIIVMKKVEACRFRIVRLVSDNHKVNVSAMNLLGNGILTYRTEHPCDHDRILLMSFDPCHVLKNVQSQFLSHDIDPKPEISSSYIKDLYKLQKGLTVKPVRYLSRKHTFPNNTEKIECCWSYSGPVAKCDCCFTAPQRPSGTHLLCIIFDCGPDDYLQE